MLAYIKLKTPYQMPETESLPKCLCCADLDDPEQKKIIDKAYWKAKLLSVYYQYCIEINSKPTKRQSPEAKLAKRLRNLEKRAQKASSLFWEDIVANEIAKRPDYFDINKLREQEEELKRMDGIKPDTEEPLVSIHDVLDWLKCNSPMINPEFKKTTEMLVKSEERKAMFERMTPQEREAYRAQRNEQMKNDPAWQRAFENEK